MSDVKARKSATGPGTARDGFTQGQPQKRERFGIKPGGAAERSSAERKRFSTKPSIQACVGKSEEGAGRAPFLIGMIHAQSDLWII